MNHPAPSLTPLDSTTAPRWVGVYAEKIIAAKGHPARIKRVFDRSSIPMLMVDGNRRYVYANGPARLAFRQSLNDLRRLRIDDLTPRYFWPAMEEAWARLTGTGCVAGVYDVASPAGTSMEVHYWATAGALPGLYLIAFAPVGWPESELLDDLEQPAEAVASLTRRELEILQLAADGLGGPRIAKELVVSLATVRTHFANIYDKLAVSDRAAAVAKGMRLGLII